MSDVWRGIASVKKVAFSTSFVFYTLAIWGSYFLHYYLTFFCFDFASHLGLGLRYGYIRCRKYRCHRTYTQWCRTVALAVKTMLILYGVADEKRSTLSDRTFYTDYTCYINRYVRMGSLSFTKRLKIENVVDN